MKAMLLTRCAALEDNPQPLQLAEADVPHPGEREILIKVSACGVCHTELDEIEGRTPPPQLPVIPGHQIVGQVAELGRGACRYRLGERVGVGWINSSSGGPDENISPEFIATGRDVNGGYAEYARVPEKYAYALPAELSDIEAAPLLCAGTVGYRALKLCGLRNGDVLGLSGFGGSNHLVLKTARHLFPDSPINVFARDAKERAFALELGAVWAGQIDQCSPEKCRAIIDTTPAWRPVVEALSNLQPGGRLVINAIRKNEADKAELLRLNYENHLWLEKEIKSVANVTARDFEEFLPIAARAGIRPEVQTYPLEDANEALCALHRGGVRGAKVLTVNGG